MKKHVPCQNHGLRRSGEAAQIETKRDKFVTLISGPLSGCPGAHEMLILPTFLQIRRFQPLPKSVDTGNLG
ncbi:MAG: hypothetical protein ACRED2_05665, partial [Methylocella sp.]